VLNARFQEGHAPAEADDAHQLRRSKDTVLIETLPAGAMGLPQKAEPTYRIPTMDGSSECARRSSGGALAHRRPDIFIMDPSVLILTKLKRWFTTWRDASTRPKTLRKLHSDEADVVYMLGWLQRNARRIEPGQYIGKSRAELLPLLRGFHVRLEGEDEGLLRGAMHEQDWLDMIALEAPSQAPNPAPSEG
jgi:hypothetical protein